MNSQNKANMIISSGFYSLLNPAINVSLSAREDKEDCLGAQCLFLHGNFYSAVSMEIMDIYYLITQSYVVSQNYYKPKHVKS